MKHFTPEEAQPSKRTLDIIRAIAYTYSVINIDGQLSTYCLN